MLSADLWKAASHLPTASADSTTTGSYAILQNLTHTTTPTLYVEWEGNIADAGMAWHGGSTGVVEAGHPTSKVRQEPGRPPSSPS